jgi:EAL domain-containing protein (putative c-di-GMP-specific phosphodiesterase class I)
VALAERHGMAVLLGEYVRDVVVGDLLAGRLPSARVAVNVSGVELSDVTFADRVLDLLELRGLDPGRLTFEVTETALTADLGHAAEALLRLRAAGFRIAIDDFGTGHASLEYLASLPCDVVKIDRRFTAGLEDDRRCAAIVHGVIGMSHGLGLTVVAEGVETPAQRDRLVDLGCEEAQGFLFGRPVPFRDLPAGGVPLGRATRAPAARATGHRPARAAAQVLVDLAHDLEQSTDLQGAFERTLEALRPHMVFTGGSVQLVGPDGIRLAAAHPRRGRPATDPLARPPRSSSTSPTTSSRAPTSRTPSSARWRPSARTWCSPAGRSSSSARTASGSRPRTRRRRPRRSPPGCRPARAWAGGS